VNERRKPHAARITVSSPFLFTVFSRGDDSIAQRLWRRLALNRLITSNRPMSQQKLGQTIAGPQLVPLGSFACSYQISQGLVSGIGHPYRGQLSRSITTGQLQRIPPVRLHAIACPYRYQGWCYYLALSTQRRQLPVLHVARWTGLITAVQFFNRTEFLYQFTNARVAIRDHSNRSHLSVLLCNGDRNRLCVDIQTNNPILFIDRLVSHVALRFAPTDSQRNPRAANRSRSFHGDNQELSSMNKVVGKCCAFG
jgi:hypothetical protein